MVRKIATWTSLISLGIWGIVLRSFGITQQSYWIDEAYSITLAQAIAQHGYPLLDSGADIWRAPAFHYLLAIPISVFGDDYIATRILSIILGVLTIILITYIAKIWFSKSAAVITFVLLTFSYWEIAWSRQARMYMMLQLFFWLTIFLFERWRSGKLHWAWPIVSACITILVHQLGWILVGAAALWYVLQIYERKPIRLVPLVVPYLGIIVGCIVAVIIASYLATGIGPVQYWTHYTAFIAREHWPLVILSLIGVAMGIYKNSSVVLWLSGIFLLSLGIVSYALPLLQYRYVFFVLPVLYLLTGHAISKLPTQYLKVGLVTLLISIGPGFILWPQTHFPLESDSAESNFSYKSFTPQPNFEAAYQYIQQVQPDVLITPYPAISRLYGATDTISMYIDLTGTIPKTPERELYTGTPYIDINTLAELRSDEQSEIILLDFFAERRMNVTMKTYLETHGTVVYEDKNSPWSQVTLYSF